MRTGITIQELDAKIAERQAETAEGRRGQGKEAAAGKEESREGRGGGEGRRGDAPSRRPRKKGNRL